MKKSLLLALGVISILGVSSAWAADATFDWNNCWPAFRGSWRVPQSCSINNDYSACHYKVYGNIYVDDKTIWVNNACTLGVSLSAHKVTFSSGRIYFNGGSVMRDNGGGRKVQCFQYWAGNGTTQCPMQPNGVRTKVLWTNNSDINAGNGGWIWSGDMWNVQWVAADGWMCCGVEGS